MPTAYVTRAVQFNAAHRYFRPEWSEARNIEMFGTAAHVHGHGHTYHCLVTVRGRTDPMTGMIVDLAMLDRILHEEIIERFDCRHLNHDVPEFEFGRKVPTGEELCLDIWGRVSARLPEGCTLDRVRVQEQPNLYAEYRGEE